MTRVMVVEDDRDISEMLSIVLKDAGMDVDLVDRGDEVIKTFRQNPPDLVLLDLMLPGKDGVTVCQELRTETLVPIVMLTAKSDTTDIVKGLEAGADDYMVKPARRQELIARVESLLRRAYPQQEEKSLQIAPFEFDLQRNELRRNGTLLELTPKEFQLAVVLFKNMGRLLSRGHLRESVWGQTGDLATRTVDTHVSQVRKKLDLRPETGFRVVPVYHYGYRLEQIQPVAT